MNENRRRQRLLNIYAGIYKLPGNFGEIWQQVRKGLIEVERWKMVASRPREDRISFPGVFPRSYVGMTLTRMRNERRPNKLPYIPLYPETDVPPTLVVKATRKKLISIGPRGNCSMPSRSFRGSILAKARK